MTIAPRKRRWGWLVLVIVVLIGAGVACWTSIRGYALTGASYGARVACSCRYAGGRDLSDCRKDFEPGMTLVSLSEDNATKSVTARFAMMFAQTATYKEGQGCMLQPWAE
ncbi:hypothetical protein OVA07_04365 [Novosphingobium sp. SL115]|uniref:hypothetical protein n=1 Tax=Novosphingobium sp. SL115 TaxID=2995150 RepID=UPI0022738147|nr:hypothetical protein [Novosphingobium sp. SL115]MCY1670242.1 hypothetical protein [Novosphingobium sp. SL115]